LEGIHTSYHYYQGGGALARNSLLKSYYHSMIVYPCSQKDLKKRVCEYQLYFIIFAEEKFLLFSNL
jgi:hypothetical protein